LCLQLVSLALCGYLLVAQYQWYAIRYKVMLLVCHELIVSAQTDTLQCQDWHLKPGFMFLYLPHDLVYMDCGSVIYLSLYFVMKLI